MNEQNGRRMNPMKLLKMKGAWDRFNRNHPKLIPFLKAVQAEGIRPDTIAELIVCTPEGKTFSTNVRITQEDLELFAELKDMQ